MAVDALYCDRIDAERIMSAAGIAAREDDDPLATLGIEDGLIDEASSDLDAYLLRGYEPAQLVDSRWVRYTCALRVVVLYCERRGNPCPASLLARWEERLELLEKILAGTMNVPGIARRRVAVPRLSIPRVQLGPYAPVIVIERRRGPQRNWPQDYPQRVDRTEPPYRT